MVARPASEALPLVYDFFSDVDVLLASVSEEVVVPAADHSDENIEFGLVVALGHPGTKPAQMREDIGEKLAVDSPRAIPGLVVDDVLQVRKFVAFPILAHTDQLGNSVAVHMVVEHHHVGPFLQGSERLIQLLPDGLASVEWIVGGRGAAQRGSVLRHVMRCGLYDDLQVAARLKRAYLRALGVPLALNRDENLLPTTAKHKLLGTDSTY